MTTAMRQLTFAVHDYDHVRDVFGPEVVTEGIELNQLKLPVEEIFFRFIKFGEFEVSEHSFAKYVSLVSKGQARGVAIPVFPSRVFRHSAIYLPSNSPIKTPKDLEGKRIGIPEWGQTAGVYVRGALADQFDVDLGSIAWIQSGVHQPGRAEKVKFNLPSWVNLTPNTSQNLNQLLLSGDVDAVITAHPIQAFKDGHPGVKRMFPDPRAVERDYFDLTGCFPIMHTVVIRQDVLDETPWVAQTLFKGLDQARARSVRRLLDATASAAPMPWIFSALEDSKDLYHGGDYWSYGIEQNRKTLETFIRYCVEQGVADRMLAPEELFFANALDAFKV